MEHLAGGFRAIGLDRNRRHQFVVGEEDHVKNVAPPIAEAVGAEVPPGTPFHRSQQILVGHFRAGAQPQVVVEIGWHAGVFLEHLVEVEILALVRRAGPRIGFDGLAKLPLAQNLHCGAPPGIGHALVAKLGDELWPGFDRLLDHHQFGELMDQRFLAIDVFAVGHGGEQNGRVRVIGH